MTLVLPSRSSATAPRWEVENLSAAPLGCLVGAVESRVALFACDDRCRPIPWQLEEHAADGSPIFEGGELASTDESPGVIDPSDEIVFMGFDAGRQAAKPELPAAICRVGIHLSHPTSGDAWVYALQLAADAPRAPTRYVQYDPQHDRLRGDGVELGFVDNLPQHLSLPNQHEPDPMNLLDRFKIRASARLLGLIPFRRNEDDLEAPMVGWRAGPVRIVRRQTQRIRVGWGIKSPRFNIDTCFYRNWATMPVGFRLNFPPTYFFSGISVESFLDFRDLRGWRVMASSLPQPLVVGEVGSRQLDTPPSSSEQWFALIGPKVQLVQVFDVSDSLAALDRRLLYRETNRADEPEAVAGEMPGIGYVLRGWAAVDAGTHAFVANTYVLPADVDVHSFIAARREHAHIETEVLP